MYRKNFFILILIFLLLVEQAFKDTLTEELKELSGSPFGSTLVGTIGLAYYEAASAELSTMDSVSVSFAQASRGISTGACCSHLIFSSFFFFTQHF